MSDYWKYKWNPLLYLAAFVVFSLISSLILLLSGFIVLSLEDSLSQNASSFVLVFCSFSITFLVMMPFLIKLGRFRKHNREILQKFSNGTYVDAIVMAVWIIGIPTLSIQVTVFFEKELEPFVDYFILRSMIPLTVSVITMFFMIALFKLRTESGSFKNSEFKQ